MRWGHEFDTERHAVLTCVGRGGAGRGGNGCGLLRVHRSSRHVALACAGPVGSRILVLWGQVAVARQSLNVVQGRGLGDGVGVDMPYNFVFCRTCGRRSSSMSYTCCSCTLCLSRASMYAAYLCGHAVRQRARHGDTWWRHVASGTRGTVTPTSCHCNTRVTAART